MLRLSLGVDLSAEVEREEFPEEEEEEEEEVDDSDDEGEWCYSVLGLNLVHNMTLTEYYVDAGIESKSILVCKSCVKMSNHPTSYCEIVFLCVTCVSVCVICV